MQESGWILIIAVAEFALIVTLVLVVIGARVLRRSRRDNAAAEELVNKVKSAEVARRGELEKLLATNYGLDGDELRDKVRELLRVEKHFYEQFIHTYLSRDAAGLTQTDERLKAVISACLAMKAVAGGETAAAGGDALAGDVDNLKSTLHNVSTDMTIYRETLNKVFSEYTAMFGVHLDPKQQLTAKEIMARLESGQLSGEDNAAQPETDEPPA